ncbi:MAG: cytochrome c [Rhodobacteraceae bacterium]|nr:cytochrome c [Paracoccaceae bacterium]MCF8514136.1 cytochrome c [Paracoccaceae bacterium]MCF8518380.1 cytochrome c [Paracoccaceae bacterium]
MKPTISRLSASLALAVGIVATTWPIPSASSPAHERLMSQNPASVPQAPDRLHLAQATTAAERPASFTSEQADRGKKKYDSECADCHGKDLKGGMNGGASLRSVTFTQNFGEGAPASALYLYLSTLMPPNSPGRYSPETYADVMAYILKRNGYKEGAALPSDVEALQNLVIQK